MALNKSSNIPKDAVLFENEREAAAYIWDIVFKWESHSQTWALKYGPVILGGVNAVCGLIINRHYRTRFKLGTYGQFSSSLPVFAMPALLTTLFHNYLIPTDMLLMKSNPCPVCYEIKSSVIQCGFGTVYPMLLAPTSALMLASRYGTYRIPDLSEGVKTMFNFLKKHTRSFTGTLAMLAAVQVVAASIITYFEMRNQIALKREMLEIEERVISEHEEAKLPKQEV